MDEVFAELEKLRQEAGVKSMSQYIADLLAMHVGRPELARELNQEVLQISA
ncbi:MULTISPECIES: toxin-antitoxin system [Mycolicibacterium]|uniref:toxin-antitoxin system n=1 Tax=Mycolicibacterium TaxID=1866885 RepID=UPI001F3B80C8|nr:toxin-antitoxin system [Mycolicibacterium conceptionense]